MALKRIPDVLSSPEQAKRVLREVCILRRLRHAAWVLHAHMMSSSSFSASLFALGLTFALPLSLSWALKDHCER